uniref:CxC2-like cysteine cluster KDZ transposase-associated domain-containing protein n=2 Tax=Psilocybe cubensis TaxID=181762 RepID=A0A8H8CEU4_PSICU
MGFKKVPDRGSDEEFPNVREASWSSGAKKRKRGRPRIHKLPAESSSTNLPQTTTYSFQNHEHNILEEEIPHYPGDLTDQQVLDNLRQLDDDRTGGKSQNDYLREWLPKREVYLGTMIGGEAPDPDLNGQCQQCQGMSGVWRCCQCFGSRILCSECLRRNHQFTPFHRVEKWTGLYFRPGALWEVGVKLYLGHNGKRCPYPTDPSHLGWDGGNNSSGSHGHGGNNSPVFEDEHGLDLDPLPASNDQESFTAQLLADPEVPHLVELDDGDDEDDDLFEEVDTTYLDQPRPKAADNNGIPFKAIVHTSGVHYLPVRTCTCRSVRLPSIDLQYLEMGLFAASFENVQTVFTVEVLEDFRMDNLECKTSAYQYYQKLRRLTSPAFPKKVLNRYRELRRLSREYRDLVLRRQYGEGHTREAVVPYYRHCHDSSPERMGINVSDPIDGGSDSPSQEVGMSTDPSLGHGGLDGPPVPQMTRTEDHPEVEDRRGKLALFCPACPQPGINLPDTWIDDADRQVLVILQGYVADGNFKADHLNQKNEGDDVWLSVGEGYMTAPGPYKEHIKEAISLAPRYKRVRYLP